MLTNYRQADDWSRPIISLLITGQGAPRATVRSWPGRNFTVIEPFAYDSVRSRGRSSCRENSGQPGRLPRVDASSAPEPHRARVRGPVRAGRVRARETSRPSRGRRIGGGDPLPILEAARRLHGEHTAQTSGQRTSIFDLMSASTASTCRRSIEPAWAAASPPWRRASMPPRRLSGCVSGKSSPSSSFGLQVAGESITSGDAPQATLSLRRSR